MTVGRRQPGKRHARKLPILPPAGKVFRIGTVGYGSTAGNVQLILESLAAALKHAEQ
jgi:hypothetical protein